MRTSEFKGNAIDLADSSTDFYDVFDPIIKKKVKEPRTWQKLLQITKEFMTKNEHALSTNIIGRRVLVNQKMEDDIYDVFGLDKKEVKKVMLETTYFKETFGRELMLTDQLCLAFPLILASLEYKRINKQDESDLCYLLAHFKPYASRESVFFKFGVKEGQMLYTLEKSLSERFDIKKYGTIINVLRKRSQSSYANYIEKTGKDEKYTDKKLYVTYTSGIAGSVNTFIGGIAEEYRKNEGKNLSFESSIKGMLDKDADAIEYSDNDIESDVAVKRNIVDKVLIRITKDLVDKKIALIASQSAFNSSSYAQLLMNTVNEITDHMFNELDPFFNALLSAFLSTDKPNNGGKYTVADFKTPIFLNIGIDILAGKKSNVKEVNLAKCRDIIKKMCETYCDRYEVFGETYKRNFRLALASYWVYLIKLANK